MWHFIEKQCDSYNADKIFLKKKKDKKKEKWGTFAPQWHQNNCSTDTSSLFMWVQTRIEKMMEITLKFNVFVYNSAML